MLPGSSSSPNKDSRWSSISLMGSQTCGNLPSLFMEDFFILSPSICLLRAITRDSSSPSPSVSGLRREALLDNRLSISQVNLPWMSYSPALLIAYRISAALIRFARDLNFLESDSLATSESLWMNVEGGHVGYENPAFSLVVVIL